MRTYIAYIKTTLSLVMRDRVVLFFNYFLPIVFFIVFAQSFGADKGGAISQVITMVLIIGVLGSGFFGAGMRAVQERELNILRRFKVAPITPMPILVASLVTGLIAYLPSVIIVLGIAHFYYKMPVPQNLGSLLIFLSLALMSFRSIGLIIASVVNSMQESQVIIQLLYLPMLFLSGATFPIDALPSWLQIVAQFLPASYLYTGLNGILVQKDSLAQNMIPSLALIAMMSVAVFLSVKLFRWEKEEKVKASSKLWIAAVMLPFLILGTYQAYSKENVGKAKVLFREMRRNRALLIRGPRIFVGDGTVIPAGGVLIRDGKIEQIFESVPGEKDVRADVIEAAGKTLMPGLIDMHVHLLSPGGAFDEKNYKPEKAVQRALAAYLFSGITAVKSVGDAPSIVRRPQSLIARGEKLGAELFHSGKIFTTPGGHGTEYFKSMPEGQRAMVEKEMLYLPKTADEARGQVRDAKQGGAAGLKAILEGGVAGMLFNRLDVGVLKAIGDEAHQVGLPLAVHTGDSQDLRDAISAGASLIEHGSMREAIPAEIFAALAKQGIAYDPTLTVGEAIEQLQAQKFELLDRTLVQQTAPEGMIERTRKVFSDPKYADRKERAPLFKLETAMENLKRAWQAGVPLVTGSDAGNMLVFHGPTVHRELQLWVRAGIPAAVALRAATHNSAKALGAGNRIGLIRKGYEASMLLVDGNPLEEIAATERISSVFFKGERISRPDLFEKE